MGYFTYEGSSLFSSKYDFSVFDYKKLANKIFI